MFPINLHLNISKMLYSYMKLIFLTVYLSFGRALPLDGERDTRQLRRPQGVSPTSVHSVILRPWLFSRGHISKAAHSFEGCAIAHHVRCLHITHRAVTHQTLLVLRRRR